MDSKVFADAGLARLLNSNFVCVRVDRDEMPHVDRVFQLAVGGGYPVNCVLTPEGEVVVAANFLPLHGGGGQAGLFELLERVAELWRKDRPALLKDARSLSPQPQPAQPVRLTPAMLEEHAVKLLMDYDWELGGVAVNRQRRFPQPTVNRLLLAYSARTGDTLGVQASSIALRKMYYGGIMDQVGGGFHRSADAEWLVPSFEKLLVDNAELAADYAGQYLATGDEEFLDALNLTLDFLASELWVGGGFGASLASDGESEGEYYTWTPSEVDEALGGLAAIGRQLFDIHPIAVSTSPYSRGTTRVRGVVNGRIVPRRVLDIEELAHTLGSSLQDAWRVLAEIRAKMRAYRDAKRRRPAVDPAKYTHPNMLAAEALLAGYVAADFSRADWLGKALEVVGKIGVRVGRRLDGGREGLAEDYGGALNALVSAYEVAGGSKRLGLAQAVGERLLEYLGAEGFCDERGGAVAVASKLDSPNESPNALCFRGLLRLAAITGDGGLVGLVGDRLAVVLGGLSKYREPLLASHYLNVDRFLSGPAHVVVVDCGDGLAEALHRAALKAYHPFKVVERVLEEDLADHPNGKVRALPRTQSSRAYFGVGFEPGFSQPIADPKVLASLLKTHLPATHSYQ